MSQGGSRSRGLRTRVGHFPTAIAREEKRHSFLQLRMTRGDWARSSVPKPWHASNESFGKQSVSSLGRMLDDANVFLQNASRFVELNEHDDSIRVLDVTREQYAILSEISGNNVFTRTLGLHFSEDMSTMIPTLTSTGSVRCETCWLRESR